MSRSLLPRLPIAYPSKSDAQMLAAAQEMLAVRLEAGRGHPELYRLSKRLWTLEVQRRLELQARQAIA